MLFYAVINFYSDGGIKGNKKEEMEEEGTTTTAALALKEESTTKMEDPKTLANGQEDEYLKLKDLLREARGRTLEDQAPEADDAEYLELVAQRVLTYLKRKDDKNKYGLGCITTTLDISGKRRKVDSKVARLLELRDFLVVLEHFFTCEGRQ